jgi:hypothetical protein
MAKPASGLYKVLQSAAEANGNGTAVDVRGMVSVAFQVTGTFVATVSFEGSVDGTNYVSLQTANVANGTVGTSTTATGVFVAACAGFYYVRAPVSGRSSGAITVIARALPVGAGLSLADIDVSGTETVTVSSITAGETHIGEVGGATVVVEVTPTVSTSAYAAGDLIGTKLTFTDAARVAGGSGVVLSAALTDLDKQDKETDLILFDTNPSNTTFTDNAAFDVHDTDLLDVIGVVTFDVADYTDFSDNSVATDKNLGIGFNLTSGQDLYGALIARGTPTYSTTADAISTRIFVLQD